MVTFKPGTMECLGPPEHVWSILSIVYNKLHLHSRGQSILQIVFKIGTNVNFCNCLDKFRWPNEFNNVYPRENPPNFDCWG